MGKTERSLESQACRPRQEIRAEVSSLLRNGMIRALIAACLILLLGGTLLHPLQKHLIAEEEQSHLLPPVFLSHGDKTTPRLEQQLSFVALGGLRSLVAAFLSINAHQQFMGRDWGNVENRYKQIVSLAPQNDYYWDTGSWHLAYNAAADSKEDTSLRPTERNIRYKSYIEKGRDFLREGIRNNPEDWFLHARLASLLSDQYRRPDHAAAVEEYRKALKLGAPASLNRTELYSLAKISGREKEAYEKCKQLFEDKENRVPTVQSLFYALQNNQKITAPARIPITRIFSSPKSASWSLKHYFLMQNEYPKTGIEEAVKLLKPYKNAKAWSDMPHSDLENLD